jgi:hypothetical protein
MLLILDLSSNSITLTRDSQVIYDPVNLYNNPKRIPGSKIRFTIYIHNNSDQDIQDVTVKEEVNSSKFQYIIDEKVVHIDRNLYFNIGGIKAYSKHIIYYDVILN